MRRKHEFEKKVPALPFELAYTTPFSLFNVNLEGVGKGD